MDDESRSYKSGRGGCGMACHNQWHSKFIKALQSSPSPPSLSDFYFIFQNSIRHNLSLHSRFKRVQNEGQGKSSWWMMNHEATRAGVAGVAGPTTTSGVQNSSKHCSHHHHHHHYRKRSNTLESASRLIEKRRPSNAMKRRDSLGSIRSLTPRYLLMYLIYLELWCGEIFGTLIFIPDYKVI